MRMLLGVVILLLLCQVIGAQDLSRQFGEITIADMRWGDELEDVEAVYLFDKGETRFIDAGNGFDLLTKYSVRVKVMTDAAAQMANVVIPYYNESGNRENISDVEAYAYNLDGERIMRQSLDAGQIFDQARNEYWSEKKFAIPDVRKGTVFEYTYTLRSPRVFNLPDWEFQNDIPTKYSEYIVKMIPFYVYDWILQGALRFSKQQQYEDSAIKRNFSTVSYSDMVNVFAMEDIPAFEDNDYIANRADYISKIDFQLSEIIHPHGGREAILTTWEEMVSSLSESPSFGKYVEKTRKYARKNLSLDALRGANTVQTVDNAVSMIKEKLDWNGFYATNASDDPASILKSGAGTCADINLTLAGVLQELGVQAYPVIISTRDHGKIKQNYPFVHFFNYVIVAVQTDNSIILTDGTDKWLSNLRIPEQCINDMGLVISDHGVNWIDLECPFITEDMTYFVIGQDGDDKVKVSHVAFEYSARDFRTLVGDNADAVRELLETSDYQPVEGTIEVKNAGDVSKPYVLTYFTAAPAEEFNNKMYYSPFLDEVSEVNPFGQGERISPVDFVYPRKQTLRSKVYVPEGMTVDYVAEDSSISNGLYDFSFNSQVKGDFVELSCSYELKKSVYKAEEYHELKKLMDNYIEKANEKVVLVGS